MANAKKDAAQGRTLLLAIASFGYSPNGLDTYRVSARSHYDEADLPDGMAAHGLENELLTEVVEAPGDHIVCARPTSRVMSSEKLRNKQISPTHPPAAPAAAEVSEDG